MSITIPLRLIAVATLVFSGCLGISSCERTTKLQPLGNDAVILAFGDSLTAGSGADKDQSYPARLQSLLSRTVINAGVPGEISINGLRRLPGLLKRYQPDLVIICHGANDILRKLDLQRTRDNIQQMIELSHSQGTQVVLIGVPEFSLFLSTAPFYQALADANRVPIEDSVLGEVLKQPALKADHVHPNAAGYAVIAERLTALLADSDAI